MEQDQSKTETPAAVRSSDGLASKMPTSPNDMPWAYSSENPNWLRNTLVTLNDYSVVDLHWENDWRESNKTGEPAGEWELTIETAHGKRISSKHEDIENVLWYVTTLAENAESEGWKKQEADREAALAKLTPDERRLLRLAR